MPLEVKVVKKKAGTVVVCAGGRLDSETAASFAERIKPLLTPATKSLSFDLAKLDYISSAGLRAILAAQKFMKSQNGTCAITRMQPPIRKVFDIAGMIPADIAAADKPADIFLEAVQRREAIKNDDISQ